MKNTIHCHYVDAIKNSLLRHEIDVAPLLKSAGIAEDVVTGVHARVPSDNFVRFMQQSILTINDEFFGLVDPALPIGTFYYGSHIMCTAPTLKKAIQKGVGYYQLFSSAFAINLILCEGEVELCIELTKPELDPDHLLAEFILIAWHRFASWLVGKNIILKKVSFDYPPPPHEAEYHYLFPALREFNQANLSLRFSTEYLTLPITKNIQDLEVFIKHIFENLLLKPIDDDSFSTKIRLLLENYDENNFPTFDVVANKLFMTSKTLRSKLKKEGVSYQKIKDILRRDIAIYYLTKQHHSIAEIAQKTGFSEASGFVRAFKNWTGLTPSSYRINKE